MAQSTEQQLLGRESFRLPFMREVYYGAGINVDRQGRLYQQRNWEKESKVARMLIDALKEDRDTWPIIVVDDPLGLVDGVAVSLQDTELWRDTGEPVKSTHSHVHTVYKDRAHARLALDRGPSQPRLGGIIAEGGENWWDVTQVQLASVRGEKIISISPGNPESSNLLEVVSFLGMLEQYLQRA